MKQHIINFLAAGLTVCLTLGMFFVAENMTLKVSAAVAPAAVIDLADASQVDGTIDIDNTWSSFPTIKITGRYHGASTSSTLVRVADSYNGEIILDNAVFDEYDMDNYSHGLTVTLKGNNFVNCLYSLDDITINGSGSLTVEPDSYFAIRVFGSLKIDGASVTGDVTKTSGIQAGVWVDDDLTVINGGSIKGIGKSGGSGGYSYGVWVYGNLHLASDGSVAGKSGGKSTPSTAGGGAAVRVEDNLYLDDGNVTGEGGDGDFGIESPGTVYFQSLSSGLTCKNGAESLTSTLNIDKTGVADSVWDIKLDGAPPSGVDMSADSIALAVGDGETAIVGFVQPEEPEQPEEPNTTNRRRSSNSRNKSKTPDTAGPVVPSILNVDSAKAKDILAEREKSGAGKSLIRHNGKINVLAEAWPVFGNAPVDFATLDGDTMQVRVTIPEPGKMAGEKLLSGYVKGTEVDRARSRFEKWYKNKVQVIHFDQTEPWGQPVNIAAKVDLSGMDTTKLEFYAYDKATNSYIRIKDPDYWIDKNGYLHFTTEYAGDIIISEGPLERKL